MEEETFAEGALETNSNGAMKQQVSQTPGAIGYVGLGFVDSSVKALEVDGVEPSVANVVNGTYPIARSLNMFTNGEPTGLAKDFIDFLLSSEGQQIVEAEGFVPIG